MGVGPQGQQGPQGLPGPQGAPVIVDQVQVTSILNNQNSLLNRLAANVANNKRISDSISEQVLQAPGSISNKLAENQSFQDNIGQNIVNNSTTIGEKIADSLISNKDYTSKLASALASQDTLISDLSHALSADDLPYRKYLIGLEGNANTINSAMKSVSMVCDTMGNCNTPKTDSYLNFTNGNLVFNNNLGTPSFRVASDGGPWIAGNSGGQLGTYNDDLNVGTVAVKWDAQGNIIVGDLSQTTGSLKIGGDMYLKHLYANGFLTAINTINVNTTDGSSYVESNLHVGALGVNKGGNGGVSAGSTFSFTKNGPYKNTDGGKNAVLINNNGNPYVFGNGSTSGNIYMLSNNDGIDPNTMTGSVILKNNSAIINNIGKVGDIKGSLMLVGNAAGDSSRVVSIKDKLHIGNWELSETTDGKFEIKNRLNPANKITLDDVLDIKSNMINGTIIRGNTIGSAIVNSGNITAPSLSGTNLISSTLNANNYNYNNDFNVKNVNISNQFNANTYGASDFTGKLTVDSIRGGGSLIGRGDISVKSVNCRGDAYVNNTIRSRNDTLYLRAPNVRAQGRLTKWDNDKWLCERLDGGEAGKRSCKDYNQK